METYKRKSTNHFQTCKKRSSDGRGQEIRKYVSSILKSIGEEAIFSRASISFHFEKIFSKHSCPFTLTRGGKAMFSKSGNLVSLSLFSLVAACRLHLFPQKKFLKTLTDKEKRSLDWEDDSKNLLKHLRDIFINSVSLVGLGHGTKKNCVEP